MDLKTSLGTSLPAVGASAVRSAGDVSSPDPPPVIGLGQDEREVYDYICDSLRNAGIEHVTARHADRDYRVHLHRLDQGEHGFLCRPIFNPTIEQVDHRGFVLSGFETCLIEGTVHHVEQVWLVRLYTTPQV